MDGRADLYAAACVLYEMLAGSPPFKRDNDVALLWAHVTEPPPGSPRFAAISRSTSMQRSPGEWQSPRTTASHRVHS